MNKCIVSLSADPITVGHRDVIKRASKMFDEVYILVPLTSIKPNATLPTVDKFDVIKHDLEADGVKNYTLKEIYGTLVDEAKELGINIIVRGLRNEQDLVYEMDMSSVNRCLNPEVETIYLPCKPELSFVSSSMVRELCRLGKYATAAKFSSKYAVAKIKKMLNQPIIVGVTGGIACGKSTCMETFERINWRVLSADKIFHEKVLISKPFLGYIFKTCKEMNISPLPFTDIGDALKGHYTLDYNVYKKLMFTNSEFKAKIDEMAWLCVHDVLVAEIDKFTTNGWKRIAVECPLLFEKGTEKFLDIFDKTICVASDENVQMGRLKKNRHMSKADIKTVLGMQMSIDEKANLCDYVIYNNGSVDEFKKNISDTIEKLHNDL